MQSLYIRNISSTNIPNKYKYYYIPSLFNSNVSYNSISENCTQLPKIIYDNSKLFYGNNKILNIGNNIYIQFEGNCKIMSNKWYIKNILEIIENYNKIFKHIQKIKIYIQIVQKKVHKNNDFSGGFASYNSVEFVFYDKIYSDSIFIKQIIAHELLHLYFPAISSKYGTCYNEGFLDYLSTILNFSKKNIIYLTNYKMKEYNRFKNMINDSSLKQERPYFIGYFYGFIMENKKIKTIINYIKKYLKTRKYMLIPWNNKKYVNLIKKNLFVNKLCKQYLI